MMQKIVFLLAPAPFFAACSKDAATGVSEAWIRSLKTLAADTVDIGGEYFVPEACPYRDFMPGPPRREGMISVNQYRI